MIYWVFTGGQGIVQVSSTDIKSIGFLIETRELPILKDWRWLEFGCESDG